MTSDRKEATMMMFKACPRCGGDLRESADIYGNYVSCIQCGHLADIPEQQGVAAPAARQVVEQQDVA
jgi:hydrogenase maturation factor HypF (carbamoyltransferase family)